MNYLGKDQEIFRRIVNFQQNTKINAMAQTVFISEGGRVVDTSRPRSQAKNHPKTSKMSECKENYLP